MASNDSFLKLDGIAGEAEDSEYAGWVEIRSWNWGASAQAGGRASGQGAASVRELRVMLRVDTSSSKLISCCLSNKLIKKAELVTRRAGGAKQQRFLQIVLEQVLVTDANLLQDTEHLIPVLQVSLSFERISYQYNPQTRSGGDGGASSFVYSVRQSS